MNICENIRIRMNWRIRITFLEVEFIQLKFYRRLQDSGGTPELSRP